MNRLPIQFEPVGLETAWQVAFVAVVLLVWVRFVRLSRPGASWRRVAAATWATAAGGLLVALFVIRALNRAWPHTWQVIFVLLAAAVIYALSHLAYRHATRPVSRRDRRLLMALRTVALVAAVLVLLRPVFVKRFETREKPYLYLVYDTSRSMAIQDGRRGRSRMDQLIRVRDYHEDSLDALRDRFEVSEQEVSAELQPFTALPTPPAGPATALGPALQRLLDRSERRPIAGIVLLTDGAANAGLDPRDVVPFLRDRHVPVYTVGFGKDVLSGQVRDIAVRTVRANASVFAHNLCPVEGELVFLGVKGETLKVELLFDGQVVDQQSVTVAEEGETRRVRLSFAPDLTGIHKVTVRAQTVDKELVTDNNEAGTYINVLSGGLGILYVEGKARWEYKFLRRALEASPDFQATPYLILAPPAPGDAAAAPANLFEWTQYDVVILGDVRPGVFTREQLEGLKTAVGERGKGLLMLGGYDSFGPGGWDRTPLADCLPVTMTAGDAQLKGPFTLAPTRAAERHFALSIEEDPTASRAAWGKMPPLDGATSFAGTKPGAEVLATGAAGKPLLVVQEYGKGRTIAFGADSTWRWAFSETDTLKYHKRFWRQVVLWLARRDQLQGERMWLALNRQRVRLGEDLEVTAYVQDAVGRAVTGCDVKAEVTAPDGTKSTTALNFQADAYRVTLRPPKAGDYAIQARAARDGKELGTAEAKFIVYVPDVEFEHPVADLNALRFLANQTQGSFFAADDADDLFDLLAEREVPENIVVHTEVFFLWDNWWVLVVFVAALVAEWVLRKRKGLV